MSECDTSNHFGDIEDDPFNVFLEFISQVIVSLWSKLMHAQIFDRLDGVAYINLKRV